MPPGVPTIADSEQQLIDRFRDGDSSALQQLHALYANRLRAFLRSRCPRSIDADDICQDVWLKAWNNRHTFDGSHFRAWIFRIARNRLTDLIRKNPSPNLPEDFDPVDVIQSDRKEELAALQDCLKMIGGDFVEVIRAQLEGEDVSQIAARKGIKPATVYTRVDRGKKQLAECVKKKLS
ncbi:MAG: RNA polymerase sigma factor [Planctomycetaceae bacterium]|nr:RNA polymerase sigma factor [Planctomycetaceae bacterium]